MESNEPRVVAAEDFASQRAARRGKPDISNLEMCIEDARKAALDGDAGPEAPTDYNDLRRRLDACKDKLPPLYQDVAFKPFKAALDSLGQGGFTKLLLQDPSKEGAAGLMLDIAQAILQNGEGYNERATDAFQEVIADTYDGYLSAEDRQGVKPPDNEVVAPLVKWGNPEWGPYTWPVEATASFGVRVAIVNMPPANARRGLLAWSALEHETAGHDILGADDGLQPELKGAVYAALVKRNIGHGLPAYWASRIDETASDIMGILNIGPAAGIGLIGYFRALNAAYGGHPGLRNDGPADDPHPADIVRGYLAASTASLLKFDGAGEWAKVIEAETEKDRTTIRLEGTVITPEEAKLSAQIVADTVVNARMCTLENHALGEIQNWYNHDETIARKLRTVLTTANQVPTRYVCGYYAAHVVAAAVTAALAKGGDVDLIFERMQTILKVMHNSNPSWGPLYVSHPGNITARLAYVPRLAREALEE
ncbi:hypothetical protein LPW11_00005 [Geomonas sp. RF6]|uniref:hypothetical protein n=1 Tax=Geomonas sp. RF6 TaxID=2897342 RepID=UPI001E2C87FE|nr:hypothetical protein [Geomonas sp. RF6]UFS70593.1 hypothetical protein LPW11_00005 [Geomonas sp. RF6]